MVCQPGRFELGVALADPGGIGRVKFIEQSEIPSGSGAVTIARQLARLTEGSASSLPLG
jgi:hypothetical protein